jgi:hypothetical protein
VIGACRLQRRGIDQEPVVGVDHDGVGVDGFDAFAVSRPTWPHRKDFVAGSGDRP